LGDFGRGSREPGNAGLLPRIEFAVLSNAGQEPARFLGIVTPGGLHEKLLSSLGEPAKTETLPAPPESPPDAERFTAIMREHDSEVLPPPEH